MTETIEPVEYFENLKSKIQNTSNTELIAQLETLAENIVLAKKVGQTNFLKKLSFTYKTIEKELKLFQNGFTTYVFKDDIKAFVDKVSPKDSVRVIELARFPRVIPTEVLSKIEQAKDLGIFDDFVVVFTDFTDGDHATPEEKEMIKRNKDPIVFGYFMDEKQMLKHDRMYFIADWEDEFCDLTFSKMITKMSEMRIKNPEKKISFDTEYISRLVNDVLQPEENTNTKPEETKSWFDRVFKRV